MEISKDQLCGKREYATLERRSLYDHHVLALCCKAALNACDKTGKVGKKIESFTKVIPGPKETFMDFLQMLTPAVNRRVLNSEHRQIML